jgi:succinate dehydrogenase/fumarate reductase flavoprotein subunit
VNANWQSSVEGLYAVGEASGTFGIYRPGGSALNSAQVGSMRSAEHIATTTEEDEPNLDFALNICSNSIDNFINEIKSILNNKNVSGDFKDDLIKAQKIMTKNAAHLRNEYQIENALTEITNIENNIKNSVMNSIYDIADYFNILSTLATQKAVLNAMLKAAQTSKSRGSGLVLDNDGFEISEHLSKFKYSPEKTEFKNAQFITEFKDKYFNTVVRKVRPIPTADNWFENVWNDFNKRNEKIFSR